jgi:rhamnogalacturonan endolyase
MKKAFTLLLLLLGLVSHAQAQTASCTWPLSPTATVQSTATGNISAVNETIGSYFTSGVTYRTTPVCQSILLNPGGTPTTQAIAHASGGYVQFEVSPLAGQALIINSLSLNLGGDNNSFLTSIEYSTSPTFASPTVIATPGTSASFPASNTMYPFTYPLPNVRVSSGNTLYVRVYGSHTQTAARRLYISNVVISSTSLIPVNGVTVFDNGTTVTMDNGIVSVLITKASGAITTFNYNGANILTGGYSGGQFYWSWNMPNYQNPAGCTYSLTADPSTNNNDYAEIKLHMTWDGSSSTAAMDVDIYYSLKRNVSGLYAAAKLSHPVSYPANPGGEWRMAAYPGATYDWLDVDADRSRLMPNLTDFNAAVAVPGAPAEVVRLTSGPFTNSYECKYDYSADFGDINTWGWTSTTNNTGLWMTAPSKEYYPGGPMKRELMCHASPVLLNMLGGTHYITGLETAVAAGENWSKVYGPFLIYCNKVAAGTPNANSALWNDAKAQALAEQSQWPYNWLTEPDYVKANGRGMVTGTLAISDAGATPSAANMWVGVAATPVASNTTDFQFWSKNYQFWVKTDANGNFTIPNVLPGTYNLYAFGPSAIGYMARTNYVTVTAGVTTALGSVNWTPSRQAPTIWEIGTPDRTSKEFKHGTDYWVQGSYPDPKWANFMRYTDEFPNEVNYTIGTSNPATDWNYVQPYNIVGAAQTVAPEWKVNFSLTTVTTIGSTASIYVAAASFFAGPLIVKVNGTNITTPTTGISFPNSSNATIRMANHGTFSDLRFNFPASLLVAGANQITFTNRRVAGDIQYDYLRLEADGTSLGNPATPLPVELTAFTATAEGTQAVRLAWTTASEKNSATFDVERSIDGSAFIGAGTLPAAGTSTAPRAYTLTDAKLPGGVSTLYYRLRQVDKDGTFSYSPVRSVFLKGAAGMALFPNPATTSTTLTGALPGAEITLFDALGRTVSSAVGSATGTAILTLPQGLPSGIYVVRSGTNTLRFAVE